MSRALSFLFLLSCASTPPPAPTEPAIAPRPFTAAQIRAAMPVGTEIHFLREAEGTPRMILIWNVTGSDEAQLTLHTQALSEDGTVLKEETESTKWEDLLKHATFPAAQTTRSVGEVDVPAGHFATLDYEVKTDDGTSIFHFANELPGPPIAFTREKGGVVVERLTLISRK